MISALNLLQPGFNNRTTKQILQQGIERMNQVKLQQTQFNVMPLKNVVGVGNTTAYQISVTTGPMLGTMGKLQELPGTSAVNDQDFENHRKEASSERRSWIRSLLSR